MKPIAIIFTDPHLNRGEHVDNVVDVMHQAGDLAVKLGVQNLICLGDFFTNRKSINLDDCLTPFLKVLNTFKKKKLTLYAIPGNHDKTDQSSFASYLDVFATHPVMKLCRYGDCFLFGDIAFGLLPFFTPDFYRTQLAQLIDEMTQTATFKGKLKYLGTHIGINGVRNNDGTVVEDGIAPKEFKFFDKVFVGHYHDASELTPKIAYIGSSLQRTFGENTKKGFTILYEDGSTKFTKSIFPEYKNFKFDVDTISPLVIDKFFNKQVQLSKTVQSFVRFTFSGSRQNTMMIDIEKYRKAGFDIDIITTEIVDTIRATVGSTIAPFDHTQITGYFKEFNTNNGIASKALRTIGGEILKEALQ